MSDHELDNQPQNGDSYQPDQQYDQVGDHVKGLGHLIATGRIDTEKAVRLQGAWQELTTKEGFSSDLLVRLYEDIDDSIPDPQFPPGLPLKLRELMQHGGDASGNIPQDTPQ